PTPTLFPYTTLFRSPTWVAGQAQLMGLESDQLPPETLPDGFNFLLTSEDARQNLSRAKLPLLIRRSKRDGGKEEPLPEANSLGSDRKSTRLNSSHDQ